MYENKILINLYVVSMDKNFEIFVPVNEKVGNITNLLSKTLFYNFGSNKKNTFLNAMNGNMYRNNDLIRNTDIKNGTKLLLI